MTHRADQSKDSGTMKLSTLFSGSVASAILLSNHFNSDLILADACPTPSFAAARAFAVGSSPLTAVDSMAVGDFNGDARPDLAVANTDQNSGSGYVSVLLGNGDGSLQASANYALGPFS